MGRVDYTNLVYYKVSTNDQVQYAVISWSKLEVQTFNMSRMIKRSFRLIARKLWVELITQAWYRIHCSNDYQRRFSMCPCPCTTIYLTLVFHVPFLVRKRVRIIHLQPSFKYKRTPTYIRIYIKTDGHGRGHGHMENRPMSKTWQK